MCNHLVAYGGIIMGFHYFSETSKEKWQSIGEYHLGLAFRYCPLCGKDLNEAYGVARFLEGVYGSLQKSQGS
jgi:hypothetical protein